MAHDKEPISRSETKTISSQSWWGELRRVLDAPGDKRGALLYDLRGVVPDFGEEEQAAARARLLEELDHWDLTVAVLPVMMNHAKTPTPWRVYPNQDCEFGHDAYAVAGVELFEETDDAGVYLLIAFYRTLTSLFCEAMGNLRARDLAQIRRYAGVAWPDELFSRFIERLHFGGVSDKRGFFELRRMLVRLEGCQSLSMLVVLLDTNPLTPEPRGSMVWPAIQCVAEAINERVFAWPWERAVLQARIEFRNVTDFEQVMNDVINACCLKAQEKRRELWYTDAEVKGL